MLDEELCISRGRMMAIRFRDEFCTDVFSHWLLILKDRDGNIVVTVDGYPSKESAYQAAPDYLKGLPHATTAYIVWCQEFTHLVIHRLDDDA